MVVAQPLFFRTSSTPTTPAHQSSILTSPSPAIPAHACLTAALREVATTSHSGASDERCSSTATSSIAACPRFHLCLRLDAEYGYDAPSSSSFTPHNPERGLLLGLVLRTQEYGPAPSRFSSPPPARALIGAGYRWGSSGVVRESGDDNPDRCPHRAIWRCEYRRTGTIYLGLALRTCDATHSTHADDALRTIVSHVSHHDRMPSLAPGRLRIAAASAFSSTVLVPAPSRTVSPCALVLKSMKADTLACAHAAYYSLRFLLYCAPTLLLHPHPPLPAPIRGHRPNSARTFLPCTRADVLESRRDPPNAGVSGVRPELTLPPRAHDMQRGEMCLNQPAPRALLDAHADAVESPELHPGTLTFTLSANPAISTLTTALAAAPALTMLRMPLPSLGRPHTLSAAPSSTSTSIAYTGKDAAAPARYSSSTSTPPMPSPSPSSSFTPHRNTAPLPSSRAQMPHHPTALFLAAARCMRG
ncbi:hypothetical protein B0H13DRAFT_2540675 [Mycena leptocephala]|nr:hypothetical protein B0H13DRAFT_2540675 [Mycena leptocephala]